MALLATGRLLLYDRVLASTPLERSADLDYRQALNGSPGSGLASNAETVKSVVGYLGWLGGTRLLVQVLTNILCQIRSPHAQHVNRGRWASDDEACVPLQGPSVVADMIGSTDEPVVVAQRSRATSLTVLL